MSYKISKELFEVVTGIKDNFWIDGIHIEFENGMLNMTVYEFFFKCKEWAFWNNYEIIVRMRIVDIYRDEHKIDYGYEINHTNNGIIKTSWWIGSEQQAVFNACQWLLDNKDKQ